MDKGKLVVMVLGAGGNVSQGIIKALRGLDMHIHIIGACIARESAGLYMCDEACISPLAGDGRFIRWYVDTCREKAVDMAFTGVEENIDVLLRYRRYIEQHCSTQFVYPSARSWEVGRDKFLTCQWLKENGCHYPDYALPEQRGDVDALLRRVGFPLIAKPRCGKGSAGIRILEDEDSLEQICGQKNYVLEQYIGTDKQEYTVGCYCDKKARMAACISMRRILKNGTTSICGVDDNEAVRKEAGKICERLHPIGPINFQMRTVEDQGPVCFEMNVRFSGTTAIRNHFGFRDVQAAVYEYVLHRDITGCFDYRMGSSVRYDEEMYFEGSMDTLMHKVRPFDSGEQPGGI